ncbi:MAG TPA: cyclic nucleotide-binding domain-containing protein [Aliidongia sp.]|nr:cyclic nucleotide-binding domain-containing protein [Aliidongia sp.]
MGVHLGDFLAREIFGLNGLVNLSNFMFLVAFAVRDALRLRVLILTSDIVMIPYDYFQQEPLWPPIFWGMAFIMVNGIRVATLTAERLPVVLNEQEEELYRLAFSCIDKRDFLRMASLARWMEVPAGEVIVKKGQRIAHAIVLLSGETEAVLKDKTVMAYRPGQLIGNVNTYSGLAYPLNVVTRSPVRLAIWQLDHIREFTNSRPELRAQLLEIQTADLADKLRESLGVRIVPQRVV